MFPARARGAPPRLPPPTLASKYRSSPFASEASNSSRPWVARSSLYAVTTGLERSKARRISVRAGSSPPISSHTMSTSGSSITSSGSAVKASTGSGTSRSRPGLRTATFATSRRHPARSAISSPWASSNRITAAPTVPHPNSPTRRVRSPAPTVIASVSLGLALHPLGRRHAEQAEQVRQHLLRAHAEPESSLGEGHVLGDHATVRVEAVEPRGEVQREVGDAVGRSEPRGQHELGRDLGETVEQVELGLVPEEGEVNLLDRAEADAVGFRPAKNRCDPCVPVLHVVDGVVQRAAAHLFDVEPERRIARAGEQREARGVGPDLVDQLV